MAERDPSDFRAHLLHNRIRLLSMPMLSAFVSGAMRMASLNA